MIFQCDNSEHLKRQLNTCFAQILEWLNDHNLSLNVTKTKLIQIKPRQKLPIDTTYSYQNDKIVTVNTCTLLGIELDSEINWKAHVIKISGKLSQFTYALYELKRSTDLKTATSAYYAYAHAWLSYGIVIWGNSPHASKLFILQKKCVRILLNISQLESCRSHFVNLKILTLTSIYIFELCKFVRNNKALFDQTQENSTQCRHNLRNRNKLTSTFTTLQIVRSGTHHMAVKVYNSVPKNIKEIEKNKVFFKKLKDFLIAKSYYTLKEYFSCNS